MAFVEMGEDEWAERYRPLPNAVDPRGASWGQDGAGALYETFGPELEHVLAQDPRHVWTLVEGDEGQQRIASGAHLVNRLGYFVTENPWDEGDTVEVVVDE